MELRVLVAERKSRKGNAAEDARYRRQENKNVRTAEAHGHCIVARVADTVSSQTLPWQRRNLKKWLTDPAKADLWDALLVSEVARISRGDSDTWYEIEKWCRTHGKYIMDADGLLWPAADDKAWDDKRRGAREYWESVRDAHAEVRADILAAGAAIGRPPWGYTTAPREDGYKKFVPDPVTAALAVEAFRKIAHGSTAASVGRWLEARTGETWRNKRVTDMIRRASYLGERDGHGYDLLCEDMRELWESANSSLDARRQIKTTGGPEVVYSYSGRVWCPCGHVLYRHKSERGFERYMCSAGRRGLSEEKCPNPSILLAEADRMIEEEMASCEFREIVTVTRGGSHARDAELQRFQTALSASQKAGDWQRVAELAQEAQRLADEPVAPLETYPLVTSRTYADLWAAADMAERRELLKSENFRLVIYPDRAEFRWTGSEMSATG